MDREIKFRAKRLDNGEWVYGHYTHNPISGKRFIYSVVDGYYRGVEVDPKTLGQFINKMSVQRIEIYEGDKLYHHYKKYVSQDVPYIVKYSLSDSDYKMYSEDGIKKWDIPHEEMTICGTIHNKEE